jgi:hypothetical protein
MTNTSATGGYLVASSSDPLPGSLTLTQFIQSVIAGITGFDGTLIRPDWQPDPPKQPDLPVDWIAFGITVNKGDANALMISPTSTNANSVLQRFEELDIQCSFYGPNCLENISVFRDGFQVQQNLEALSIAKMGFKSISDSIRSADLFNERWYDRFITTLTLVRQVQRTYPVLSFASASGTIHTVLAGNKKNFAWKAGP